jgi:hypothetical protein
MIKKVVRTSGIVIAMYSTIRDVEFDVLSATISELNRDYGAASVWSISSSR